MSELTPCSALIRRGVSVFMFAAGISGMMAADITGRAIDVNTGSFLSGVAIEIMGRDITAVSDANGYYRLTNVPPGAQQVRANFLGYDPAIAAVTVPSSGDVVADVSLGGEVQRMAAFTVEGYREGRSRALQQKQTATNISDIISADAVGNLPDRNVAEAVARLPGVNLSLEQGEGRYVSIRGIEPNLNQVLMDGETMSAPGGTRLGRAVPLDSLSASQIAQIEVIKSATPDMDANSLGGTVNIKTTSGFDRKGRFISGSGSINYNESTEKKNIEGQLTFADTFGPNRTWGLAASASYDKRHYSNEWLQVGGWNQRTINGAQVFLPSSLEIKPERGQNQRMGATLNLEYRPAKDLQLYFRTNYSTTNRYEDTHEIIHSVDNNVNRVTMSSPTAGEFNGAGVRTERREFHERREQDLLTLSGGIKKIVDNFTIEGTATHSKANEDRPYTDVLAFRNGNGGTGPVTFNLAGFDFRRWDVNPTIDLPSKYPLRRTRQDFGTVEEETQSARLDVRWDPDRIFGHRGFVKTGFKYVQRDRVSDLESRRLVPVGNWNLGAVGVLPGVSVYDDRFPSGFLLDYDRTWQYLQANPALTTVDPVESLANSVEDDYAIKEYIYSGYAMASLKLNQLTLLGGLRWERTDATIRAVQVRSAGSTLLGRFPTVGTAVYDDYFPNVQAVYRFTERVLLRGAITETIGRPAYEDARPLARFRYDPLGAAALSPAFPFSGTLDVGNPELGPYRARNFDLSFEWYMKSRGMISLAAFRKNIDNPIYTFSETQRNLDYSGIPLEFLAVTIRRNAESAEVTGAELNLYQPFSFLPSPFNGFGVDLNLTRITSEVKIPTRRADDLPFFRQPGKIANFTLFYEKAKFSGRIAWNYADDQLYTLGSNALNDVYRKPRGQWDLLLRYRVSSHYSITGSVRNLTRASERFEYGPSGSNLTRTSRLLERDYKVGVNVNY
jgi:TonB-dependent receptor